MMVKDSNSSSNIVVTQSCILLLFAKFFLDNDLLVFL